MPANRWDFHNARTCELLGKLGLCPERNLIVKKTTIAIYCTTDLLNAATGPVARNEQKWGGEPVATDREFYADLPK